MKRFFGALSPGFLIFLQLIGLSLPYHISAIEKRKEFPVPLADLMVARDRAGRLEEVFVSFGSEHEGWAISPGDDRYVKDNRKMRLDHTYRELGPQAYQLSPFEVEILDRVVESFSDALAIFERDLRNENWGKCLYLDAWFAPFFDAFYYLFTAARNSSEVLPAITRIPDSIYERTFASEKTDARIARWRQDPQTTMKLRIAAKELIYQIKMWRKKELSNSKRDPWLDSSGNFAEAYELFIRLYFDFPPKKP